MIIFEQPYFHYDLDLGVYFLSVTLDGRAVNAVIDTASKYTVMSRRVCDSMGLSASIEARAPQLARDASGGGLTLNQGFTAKCKIGMEPNLFSCTLHVRVTSPEAEVGFNFIIGNDFLRVYAQYAPVADTIALWKMEPSPPTTAAPGSKINDMIV